MTTVTVLIPNYNRGRMLQDALRSVLAQTHQDFEILVVDDGSTEDIPAALAPFGDRVRYMYKQNGGPALARNFGLQNATGDYVAFLDNDDLWVPRKLERQVEALQKRPGVGMVSCQAFVMDEDGRVFSRPPQGSGRSTPLVGLADLAEQNVIVGGCSSEMVRVEAIREINGFNPDIRFVEDWDCWLQIARRWQLWMIPEPLSYYRINSQGHRNHAPSPLHVDETHSNILRVLDQAFDHWPASEGDPAPIQARAYAREYLRHSLVLYAVDRPKQGKLAWELALAKDATSAATPANIKPALISCAVGYVMGLPTSQWAKRATQILTCVLSDPPHAIQFLLDQRSEMESALFAELAFLAAQHGDFYHARMHGLRCLAHDLSWSRNIGLIKLILAGGSEYAPVPVQEHMARLS